jgi:hypothetical protein
MCKVAYTKRFIKYIFIGIYMMDIFEENIFCSKCGKKMKQVSIVKNGFKIRAMECSKCGKHIYHPADIQEFKRFSHLKRRPFSVKLRMVGHSYVVSIPREIINFQEHAHREMRDVQKEMAKHFEHMNKMVDMWLEEPDKLTLSFEKEKDKLDKLNKLKNKKNITNKNITNKKEKIK